MGHLAAGRAGVRLALPRRATRPYLGQHRRLARRGITARQTGKDSARKRERGRQTGRYRVIPDLSPAASFRAFAPLSRFRAKSVFLSEAQLLVATRKARNT